MKKQITTLLAVAVAQLGLAQETSATLYGYVRGEFAYDSRQVIAAREGNYIDLAEPKFKAGSVANFNGWGVESRLGVKIAGPEFFGMKSEALIESHFFGSSDANINGLALRHAYVKLSNDDIEIMAGQYWHPMFVTNVSPGTYNFNAGSPFQPFNRSPQIRFSTKGNVRFTAAAVTERDFASVVIGKGNAAKSGFPAFHAQLQFGDDSKFVGGFGANFKTTRNLYGVDENNELYGNTYSGRNLSAWNFLAYAKANLGGSTVWKGYANYGNNPSELLQLGGVSVDENNKLHNNRTFSFWSEFSGNFSPSFEWGVFGGYSRDNGFKEHDAYDIKTKFGEDLGQLGYLTPSSTWRISPRLGWKSGNTKLAAELDYSATTYGLHDYTGTIRKIEKDATGDNLRVSLSLIQTF